MRFPRGDIILTIDVVINEQAIGSEKSPETVYCLRDLWYFRAANGEEIGPFRYRSEAESGLQRYRDPGSPAAQTPVG